jgi:hypothetical protein
VHENIFHRLSITWASLKTHFSNQIAEKKSTDARGCQYQAKNNIDIVDLLQENVFLHHLAILQNLPAQKKHMHDRRVARPQLPPKAFCRGYIVTSNNKSIDVCVLKCVFLNIFSYFLLERKK